MRLLGYHPQGISLDMLAEERVIRALQATLEGRTVTSGRRYQIYQEIKLVLWWIADRMRGPDSSAAAILENPRNGVKSFLYLDVSDFYKWWLNTNLDVNVN